MTAVLVSSERGAFQDITIGSGAAGIIRAWCSEASRLKFSSVWMLVVRLLSVVALVLEEVGFVFSRIDRTLVESASANRPLVSCTPGMRAYGGGSLGLGSFSMKCHIKTQLLTWY